MRVYVNTNTMAKVFSLVLDPLSQYLDFIKDRTNTLCNGVEPWKIILYTCGTTILVLTVKDVLYNEEETLKKRAKKFIFRWVRKIPAIKRRLIEEEEQLLKETEATFHKQVEGVGYVLSLPKTGLSMKKVLEELQKYRELENVDWKRGMASGTVYSGEEDLTELMSKTYGMFAWSNPLHPEVFPEVRKMEAEVVRMCCNMFNGGPETCGTMTSGGTESILLACLSYRNRARENGINFPEMIIPVTVHAAFDKAAEYFRMKITHIPIDEKTRKVDIKAMKRAINRNTCMLVGSAPNFGHGIIDSIEEIAELGQKYNIPVHVDCCLGGFLYPFMEKAGFKIPICDFRLPGVTSISADTHKYGFAPKGSSVILYSNKIYRKYQFFVQPDWPGGIYATSTMGGSRAGAIISACWATMMYMGESGYVESTKKIVSTARYVASKLREIQGVKVYGEPLMSVIGIGSDVFNIFRLADYLTAIGWNLNSLQYPNSIHLCCTLCHTKEGVADKFIEDVKAGVQECMKDPDSKIGGMGAIYGMAQSIPDKSVVQLLTGCYLNALYSTSPDNSNPTE